MLGACLAESAQYRSWGLPPRALNTTHTQGYAHNLSRCHWVLGTTATCVNIHIPHDVVSHTIPLARRHHMSRKFCSLSEHECVQPLADKEAFEGIEMVAISESDAEFTKMIESENRHSFGHGVYCSAPLL